MPTESVVFKLITGCTGYALGSDGSVVSSRVMGRRSTDGSIRIGCLWRPVKCNQRKDGYTSVNIPYDDGKYRTRTVHRLILEAFVGPCPPGCEACHANGVRNDNRLVNLRWDTRSANREDARHHGTLSVGTDRHNCKLEPEKVALIRSLREQGSSYAEIARTFSVHPGTIRDVVTLQTWKHVGS